VALRLEKQLEHFDFALNPTQSSILRDKCYQRVHTATSVSHIFFIFHKKANNKWCKERHCSTEKWGPSGFCGGSFRIVGG